LGTGVAQSVWRLDYGLDDRGPIFDRGNDGIFFSFRLRAKMGFVAHRCGG